MIPIPPQIKCRAGARVNVFFGLFPDAAPHGSGATWLLWDVVVRTVDHSHPEWNWKRRENYEKSDESEKVIKIIMKGIMENRKVISGRGIAADCRGVWIRS